MCHLLVTGDKATAFHVKRLDSVAAAIVANVDYAIGMVEIVTAYQLGQAKNTLAHVHGVRQPRETFVS